MEALLGGEPHDRLNLFHTGGLDHDGRLVRPRGRSLEGIPKLREGRAPGQHGVIPEQAPQLFDSSGGDTPALPFRVKILEHRFALS